MVGLKQEIRQSQQLVMTQQLQQSIKLLQLSSQEVQAFIEEELEKNPLLQREESESEGERFDAAADANSSASLDGNSRGETHEEDGERTADMFDQAQSSDYGDKRDGEDEISHAFSGDEGTSFGAEGYSAGAHTGYRGDTDIDDRSLEDSLASEENLRDVLTAQIAVEFTDAAERLLAVGMIDYLDDAGYLREDFANIAHQSGVDEAMVRAVHQQLLKLEPAGIFARDLTECLQVQLQDMNRMDPAMEMLLKHLSFVAEGKLLELQKLCGVDAEDFAEMLTDIRRCNPKPASNYVVDNTQAVIPDVLVRRGPDNSWFVELNPDALPRVLVRREYAAQIGGKADKSAKKYVNEQLANANWLVRALDQRAQTILKVAEEIIKKQDMFLMHGIRFLKPLVLRDIASAIGMHESTVSRVTNNKFMATPRGTLEMKYFFTSSIGAATGVSEFSSKTVMYYIKEAIDGETAQQILSDDAIVALLKRRNIDVARRTVTKYREAMNIPSSVVRRRQKRQGASS